MDYLQTLFGFFNAPLFATFILGMFWKRMTADRRLGRPGRRHPGRGRSSAFLSEDALGAVEPGVIPLGGPGRELRRGRRGVRRRHRGQRRGHAGDRSPKPESELRGLVYSETPKEDLVDPDEAHAARGTSRTMPLAGDRAVMVIILNIIFW